MPIPSNGRSLLLASQDIVIPVDHIIVGVLCYIVTYISKDANVSS